MVLFRMAGFCLGGWGFSIGGQDFLYVNGVLSRWAGFCLGRRDFFLYFGGVLSSWVGFSLGGRGFV